MTLETARLAVLLILAAGAGAAGGAWWVLREAAEEDRETHLPPTWRRGAADRIARNREDP